MPRQSRPIILLTENNIHNWVGESQFNRGMQYVNESLVLPHSYSGKVIKGWCLPRAGQAGSYYVWARLNGLRIGDAHCTCPLGKYGICPHVAAVLVACVRQPAQFRRTLLQRVMGWFYPPKPMQTPATASSPSRVA